MYRNKAGIHYLCSGQTQRNMNTSIMHKAFGVSKQECLDMLCENNQIILKIQTLCCPECGSHNVVWTGNSIRKFVSVPLGCAKTYLEMKVHRLKCHYCGAIKQEEIDFAKGKRRHTIAFANMVIDLSRFATMQNIACFLDVSWDVVKNIQMEYLQKEYSNPAI